MMRLLVLGAAVSGRATAQLAEVVGDRVTVFDGDPNRGAELIARGLSVVTGDWERDLLDGVDLVVASPGFSIRSAPVLDAFEAGVGVISEMEYGSRHLESRIAAVTGTNGKTTVTELTAAMLRESGVDAVAAGNIGLAVSEVAAQPEHPTVVVVEASSFQLTTIDTFHPDAAVFLNLAPDHLDWHGSFEAYAAAKTRILERQGAHDLVVYGADDAEVSRRVATAVGRLVPVSGRHQPEGGSGPADGRLVYDREAISFDALPRTDESFVVDAAAAWVAASHFGGRRDGVERALTAYRPAAHRRMVVATAAGITYVDDSKATNPHAAVAAVAAYPSVVLIAGGRNKGLDLSSLATATPLRHLVTMGEAADELARAATVPTDHASNMDEAVAIATSVAGSGDTVLLAPGCASFDMFDDYRARGAAFAEAVNRLLEGS